MSRRMLSMLLISLLALGIFGVAEARQAEFAPILARVGASLYAVSPDTGEARLLDQISDELSQLLLAHSSGVGITLDGISPDNTLLAYTAALPDILKPDYADKAEILAQNNPNDVFIVNITTGERTDITHQQLADLVATGKFVSYTNVIWSQDGAQLYFVANVHAPNTTILKRTLYVYDLSKSSLQPLTNALPPTDDMPLIGLYPVSAGVLAVMSINNNGDFQFQVISPKNGVIKHFKFHLDGALDVNSWAFDLNPILSDKTYTFGYFGTANGAPLPSYLNLTSGTGRATDPNSFLTSLSHAAPESSLRVVVSSLFTGDDNWAFADKDGNALITPQSLNFVWDTAIAPDGQSIAYLGDRKSSKPRDLFVFDGENSRPLSFAADQILWGSVDHIFAPLIQRG